MVMGLSGGLSGEGSCRVLCVFWMVIWIEVLGFRYTLFSPFLHNTSLTIGFTGVLRVPRHSACYPPPPPHRRVMATRHSPVLPYHVGWRFLGWLGAFLLAAPPSPHRGSVLVVLLLYLFFRCSVRTSSFVGMLLSDLVRSASCLLDARILLEFFRFIA
jgi:hypothetical protein